MMAKVWARIRETIERHGSACLLSVVGSAGSVPRESGADDLVAERERAIQSLLRIGFVEMAQKAGRTRRRAVPRLAAGTQSRPVLRRHGENADRNLRFRRPSGGAASGSLIHSADASSGIVQFGGRRPSDFACPVDVTRDPQDQRLFEAWRHDLHADRQSGHITLLSVDTDDFGIETKLYAI